ncbi:50S ribosomal protein L29 [bacterium]|nr:50S ribosomal protein L29 [bacterium]
MKLKDYKKKINSMSDKELALESQSLSENLLGSRFKISVNNFKKVREIREARKNLARIKTEIRNRELKSK